MTFPLRSSWLTILTAVTWALAQPAFAETFTVTNVIADAPGGLRQVLASLPAPGPHRVEFNLPGPGPHTINLDGRGLLISSAVEIDGYSQPGAMANTSASGWNANLVIVLAAFLFPPKPAGIHVTAGLTLRGLKVDLPLSTMAVKHSPEERVVITGCELNLDFLLVGQAHGFRLGGPTPADRNFMRLAPAYVSDAPDAVIEGNLFEFPFQRAPTGRSFQAALYLLRGNPGLVVRNNVFHQPWNAIVVAAEPGQESPRLEGNTFFDNRGLAIDVEPFGPTPNDPGDAMLPVNHPALDVRQLSATGGLVGGVLSGAPHTLHTVELYSSAQCDPSGFGEGEVSLGTTQVTTDASGAARFTFTLPSDQRGRVFTALATSPRGTSEFGPCLSSSGAVEVPTLSTGLLALLAVTLAALGVIRAKALARYPSRPLGSA